MAKMTELPYELLHYIILLLVQSPGGAADFARIISVCKKFVLFAQDKNILKLVNFDIRMEFKNFKRYQHINSLLVICSEAENIAAQFFLGKVILVSSSQLLLGEWHKVERDSHHCDLATLAELRCIVATNCPMQNHEVGSFMAYFLPKQASMGGSSQTGLVHYQLVKLFLLNGSLNDLAEMSVFLKSYIKFFTSVTEGDSPLLKWIKALVYHADSFRCFEERHMEIYRRFAGREGCESLLDTAMDNIFRMKSLTAEIRAETLRVFELNLG